MFEEEAEEYVMRDDVVTENDRVPFDNGYGYQTVDFETEVKKAFKDGAEFGYNKANEWHYPSKGEYPKVGTWIIGFYYGKDNWHKIFYRTDGKWWGEGQLCQPPFAWKEIVLPKESE